MRFIELELAIQSQEEFPPKVTMPAATQVKAIFQPLARLFLGIAILVVTAALLASPVGLWSQISTIRANYSESRRLGVPACRECGAPAKPIAHIDLPGVATGGHTAVNLCARHSSLGPAADDMDLFVGSWPFRLSGLAMFQIILPLCVVIDCWQHRFRAIGSDELACLAIIFPIAICISFVLYFTA